MKNKVIKIVNEFVVIATVAMVVFGGIFVILNWPSFYQRMSNISSHEQKVEAEEVQTSSKITYFPHNDSLNQYLVYPDFFVSKNDIEVEKNYQDKVLEGGLMIPKLGISAPIKFLDSLDDATMKSMLKEGVVHYPNTAMPGQKGNVFIFGHSSYYWWDWSEYNSIFASLEKISIGDDILLKSNGKLLVYRVKNTKVVESDDLSVLEQTSNFKLTLMTCTPLGTDLQRFIVEAELVN